MKILPELVVAVLVPEWLAELKFLILTKQMLLQRKNRLLTLQQQTRQRLLLQKPQLPMLRR